jgi:hypothetical protein
VSDSSELNAMQGEPQLKAAVVDDDELKEKINFKIKNECCSNPLKTKASARASKRNVIFSTQRKRKIDFFVEREREYFLYLSLIKRETEK